MSSLGADPPRWKDRAEQANLAERMAGRLIRAMGAAPVLSGPQLARIEAAAREEQRRPGLVRWWPAAAVGLLVSGATFAVAARLDLVPRWLRLAPAAPESAPSARSPKPHSARTRPARTSAPVPAAPAPATPPEIQATAEPTAPPEVQVPARRSAPTARLAFVKTPDPLRVSPSADRRPGSATPQVELNTQPATGPAELNPPPAARPADPPVAPPPAGTTRVTAASAPTLSAPPPAAPPATTPSQFQPVVAGATSPQGGARWLAEALHSLRTDHAPSAALALLDRHATELKQSAFVHEAMLLRVEALLSLKRSDEALDLLDGKALSNVAASRTLLLTRAELRAAAGRCADGLSDFDLLLARARQPDEQALYGRAVCRSRIGDKPGAQADFELYRRQFPNGAHIHHVEKQLAGAAKSAGPVP